MMSIETEDERPDPDRLLAEIRREEQAAQRGKLKIFFGAAAGVGKTYAMLSAAQAAKRDGRDVVVGLVETHGRQETVALLTDLEVLPCKDFDYRGRVLQEFDLDAALARQPALILVDELAHANLAGSRHPRRWQDVEELLAAGIDVYSTLNVQHLESLNDVVGGITGIRVWETVPDRVFDDADEVVLVDLTPDELLRRFREGKVYVPQQAERAVQNFFRKGNLIALRELALRRTADRVDEDVRAYRASEAIERVWATRDALLACVGPRPGAEKVVRAAARLADKLGADWHAVYVETPALQRLPDAERQRILRVLKLAQDLGAQTATLGSEEVAATIVDFARTYNIAQVFIGRRPPRWLERFRTSPVERVARLAPEINLVQVTQTDDGATLGNRRWGGEMAPTEVRRRRVDPWRYVWACGVSTLTTIIAFVLLRNLEPANIVMLFLLAVVLAAIRFGRGPSTLTAVLNVIAFDLFFVHPQFSMGVSDVQYLPTFAVMLVVGLITSQLTHRLRFQARVAFHREARARALYEMARELSAALEREQVTDVCDRLIEESFRAQSVVLLADAAERLIPASGSRRLRQPYELDLGIAQWAYDHAQPAGLSTDTLPGNPILYLPLKGPSRIHGVLAIEPAAERSVMIPEQRRQLETFASLIAIALERVHYVEIAQEAVLKMESERLRNSLLAAISHDLRTPLTALVGTAEALSHSMPQLEGVQAEFAASIRVETLRLSRLVNNLLDMARLEAGEVQLRIEWQSIEEVVGSALNTTRGSLMPRGVCTEIPADTPLVRFDAVLIESALCNLLENAAKYTQPSAEVRIEIKVVGPELQVAVADNGPGLPPGMEKKVFEKFARGKSESAVPGVGLGLAITRSIVEAHHGRIWAEAPPEGGVRFVFTLPLGNPPDVEPEALEADIAHA